MDEKTEKKNNKIYIVIAIIIFAFATVVRIWNWPNIIYDINCDEAMTAINAKSIAQSGTDIYGTSYPVYFESWLIGGQSSVAVYTMAFFIKIFGFSKIAVRLPILIVSLSSLVFMFLLIKRICKDKKLSLIVLFLLAINPWDIVQSNWCLDCNFYPHIMLISIYLLYIGIEDKKSFCLYFSMLFFALTLYTYGIALYLTPIFLFLSAIYLLVNHKINIKKLVICVLLFIIIAIPIIMMTVINLFNLPTIHIGKITIQNYSYVIRTNDMLLFSKNKIETLVNNLGCLGRILMFQNDELIWNSFPQFGTIYLISLPIILCGLIAICCYFTKNKEAENDELNNFGMALILIWLIIGIICGILINDININRINIIWYPCIILNGIGIYEIIKQFKYKKIFTVLFVGIYLISFVMFITYYYTIGNDEINNSFTWSQGLVEAVEYAEKSDINNIVLSESASRTDKKDIFIRYATDAKQIEQPISKEEFIKYNLINLTPNFNFSTQQKEYTILKLEEETILTQPVYIIMKQELNKIENIDSYKIKEFNKYLVLMKGK